MTQKEIVEEGTPRNKGKQNKIEANGSPPHQMATRPYSLDRHR